MKSDKIIWVWNPNKGERYPLLIRDRLFPKPKVRKCHRGIVIKMI